MLTHATLIKRYKRFLADVRLDDGTDLTVHCPNTGSMKNCMQEGADVWLSHSENKKRKYAYTWERIKTSRGHFIGINTNRANGLVADAIAAGVIEELQDYEALQREVTIGNSRIDLCLTDATREACFVEVKSVTLLENPASRGVGYFPDAVSERGVKHLRELQDIRGSGNRAVLMFCVQHSGIGEVRPAAHIDPLYAAELLVAVESGVEVLAYKASFRGATKLTQRIPVNLDQRAWCE